MKTSLIASLVLCTSFLVAYETTFRTAQEREGWRLSNQVTFEGDTLVLKGDNPDKAPQADRALDVKEFAGHFVRLSFEACSKNVAQGDRKSVV